jgi:hypothetical protein
MPNNTFSSHVQDRAAAATRTIAQIFDCNDAEKIAAAADYLRDEFDDAVRQAISEIRTE